MKHLVQSKDKNCGQTCIAMIAGRSIQAIEYIVGHDCGMDLKEVIPVCERLKISIEKKWVMKICKKWIGRYLLPFNCFIHIIYKNNNKWGHLIIRNKGKFLDPDGKQSYFLKKQYIVEGYLKIK